MLVGRLARDPDLRMTAEGVARAWFVLAVPRPYAGRDGEREADFINIVAWRQLAGVIGEHLTKGRLVGITGRMQVFSQENGDGTWRTTSEVVADQVVFLDAPRRSPAEE
ncbi:MAG TPA: single-stranded DNA-binding protein [Gemmatimonadales bacterium]|nr:single-stranded DNA-binding protein [Gemmatimonadales bacterium]